MNKKAALALMFAGGLTVGAAGTGLYLINADDNQLFPKQELSILYDNVFDRDFFEQSHSPFAQMDKMRKEMDKFFESTMEDFPKFSFEEWYGEKFGGTLDDIEQKEDADTVTYEIDLRGVDKGTLKTEVSDGQVTISGSRSEREAQEEGDTSILGHAIQTFKRSFPVPAGVDADRVQYETRDDKLLIKFPKVPEERGEVI